MPGSSFVLRVTIDMVRAFFSQLLGFLLPNSISASKNLQVLFDETRDVLDSNEFVNAMSLGAYFYFFCLISIK